MSSQKSQAHLCMGGGSLPTELTSKPKWVSTPQQLLSIFRPQCPLQDGQNSCPAGVDKAENQNQAHTVGTSLVVQELRIHLAIQGCRFNP